MAGIRESILPLTAEFLDSPLCKLTGVFLLLNASQLPSTVLLDWLFLEVPLTLSTVSYACMPISIMDRLLNDDETHAWLLSKFATPQAGNQLHTAAATLNDFLSLYVPALISELYAKLPARQMKVVERAFDGIRRYLSPLWQRWKEVCPEYLDKAAHVYNVGKHLSHETVEKLAPVLQKCNEIGRELVDKVFDAHPELKKFCHEAADKIMNVCNNFNDLCHVVIDKTADFCHEWIEVYTLLPQAEANSDSSKVVSTRIADDPNEPESQDAEEDVAIHETVTELDRDFEEDRMEDLKLAQEPLSGPLAGDGGEGSDVDLRSAGQSMYGHGEEDFEVISTYHL